MVLGKTDSPNTFGGELWKKANEKNPLDIPVFTTESSLTVKDGPFTSYIAGEAVTRGAIILAAGTKAVTWA